MTCFSHEGAFGSIDHCDFDPFKLLLHCLRPNFQRRFRTVALYSYPSIILCENWASLVRAQCRQPRMASSLFNPYQPGQASLPVMDDKENILPASFPQPSTRLGGVLSSTEKQQPTRGSIGKGRTPLSDITSLCLVQVGARLHA